MVSRGLGPGFQIKAEGSLFILMEKDSLVEMVGGEREGGDLTRRAIPCERGSADSIVAVSCEHL